MLSAVTAPISGITGSFTRDAVAATAGIRA
jgi:hypothetical protein